MTGVLWVTGAAGFTGVHLAGYLKRLPDRPRLVGLDLVAGPAGLDSSRLVDLTDSSAVAAAAREDQPTWVIHLAGRMPPATEQEMWQTNVAGTAGLLAGLIAADCESTRVVSAGSAAEYAPGGPDFIAETHPCGGLSAYGRVKWAQSLLVLGAHGTSGLQTMVVRPFNLLGPGLPSRLVAGWLCEQAVASSESGEIVMGNTKTKRDFVDVRDAVQAYWAVALGGKPGEVYNVCSGRATSIEDLLDELRRRTGKRLAVRVDPKRLRGNDPPVVVGDPGKLRQATGWEARIDVRQSIADMLAARTASA